MKSFPLLALREMALRDTPDPQIREPHDVLIKMGAVGVCGSDIHYYTTGRIGSQVVEFPFTVLEVVERSKTSLRSFYQHFSTKDELLLALIDKIMSESTRKWREDTTGLESTAALRVLVDRICTPAESSTQDRVNRGLTDYNDHLAETLPREYARVLSPLHELIKDIINRGITEGTFRTDLDIDATAALIM